MGNDYYMNDFATSCPTNILMDDKILLAHGSGGSRQQKLLDNFIFPYLNNTYLAQQHDGSIIDFDGLKLAFTTDSYVVEPIFFPGGDIGKLAVCGTVNDLAVCGAEPKYLSLGFILEEGFLLSDFEKIVKSIRETADLAGVCVVTGDTKVVGKGKGDKIFINISGIGVINGNINISPFNCKPGDCIIINGNIAEHGIAILSQREGFSFETGIESDCSPLNGLISSLLKECPGVKMMRDPTRGGVATILNEIASTAKLGISVSEDKIPITQATRGACELLGFDPLYIANEGKVIVFVDNDSAGKVLEIMRKHTYGRNSEIIGSVTGDNPGTVILHTSAGTSRIIDLLTGEQLPRIC